MTAPSNHIDSIVYLEELLTQVSPGLMRQMFDVFINQILLAQADMVCGADYGARIEARTNLRNGLNRHQSRQY